MSIFPAAMTLESGMSATVVREVTDALTAVAIGSGDVPVFATPAVLALIEEACCTAIAGALPPESTSVGTWVELEHVAASKIGASVSATAVLDAIDGRTLSFSAEAHEGDKIVARAKHRRAIVDRSRFS